MKEDNILCTCSGGRSSLLMAIMLKTRFPNKNIKFVFDNTSKEAKATYDFIDICDRYFKLGIVYLEAVVNPKMGSGTTYEIVEFKNLKRDGSIFESVIKKYGLPSKMYRHCTREMKENINKKYADKVFGKDNYIKALGIRADEPHRLKPKKNVFYPLAEWGVTKQFVLDWWSRQEFDLMLEEHQGNCDLCFLKSKRKRMTVLKENPEIGYWWLDMELKYADDEKQPMFDVRNNLTIEQLLELSKTDFTPFSYIQKQEESFDLDMDIEFSCYCTNT